MTKVDSVVSSVPTRAVTEPGRNVTRSGSFAEVLRERESIKFSRHAVERMHERNIPLSEAEHRRLEAAIGQAASKGARDTVVMLSDRAFIVSVVNRTVVTAIDAAEGKDRLMTNIDSVIVV